MVCDSVVVGVDSSLSAGSRRKCVWVCTSLISQFYHLPSALEAAVAVNVLSVAVWVVGSYGSLSLIAPIGSLDWPIMSLPLDQDEQTCQFLREGLIPTACFVLDHLVAYLVH